MSHGRYRLGARSDLRQYTKTSTYPKMQRWPVGPVSRLQGHGGGRGGEVAMRGEGMTATYRNTTYYPIYIDPWLQLEIYQAAIDEARRKRRRYGYLTCEDCGCDVAENWIIRHYKSGCALGAR
jgi:hypothetical protein